MSNIKRLTAILVAVLIIISSAAACNANATWIMKVDGEEIPVGIYICYIMEAEGDAQDKVDESLEPETTTTEEADEDTAEESADEETAETETEAQTEAETTTEAIDYYEQKIDDKSYTDWIKDEAIQRVKEHIVVKQKFEEYKLELTDEQIENIKSVWTKSATTENTYGDYYEMNGVSQSSFEEYLTVSYQKSELMKYYYGEDGEEPISNEDLTKELTENYATAYILSQSKMGINADQTAYENYSDEIINEMKDAMQDYIKRLDKNEDYSKLESDFKADMAEILETEVEESDTSETVSAETEETEEAEEKLTATPNIQLRDISDESDEVAAALKKAKVGKAGLAESDGVLTVYQKTNDLTENPYYLDLQKETIIKDLKGDEFDELIEKWAGELKTELNKKAKSAYGPKELKTFDD